MSTSSTAATSDRDSPQAAAGHTASSAPKQPRMSESVVRNLGLVGVMVILVIIGVSTAGDRFLSGNNLLIILELGAMIAVVSVGMTFVIAGGGIDLSVGAIAALASVWATTAATQYYAEQYGFWVMVMCALLVGTVVGAVNGFLVAYGRIVPFIMTLAMLAAARGLAEQISDNRSQLVTVSSFADVFRARLLGIPVSIYIMAAVAVGGWVLLNRTTFGRRTLAVGGNAEAARLAGIDVRRHTMLLYTLLGLCCGIAAVMITARTTTGTSTHGLLWELDAIAAVVIGGTLLSGGRGTIVGTLLGVLIFTTVTNIFTLNFLPTATQQVAKGAIIVVAVLLQQRLSGGGGLPPWLRRPGSPGKLPAQTAAAPDAEGRNPAG
ncbi:ABC transporter permease [Aquipuribacter sp. MA13-6]|uniref:ABC transporter permease n=1 Tax=unclassified Aquipuribacter TaxID=2635084 RepID=UPI003EEBDB72